MYFFSRDLNFPSILYDKPQFENAPSQWEKWPIILYLFTAFSLGLAFSVVTVAWPPGKKNHTTKKSGRSCQFLLPDLGLKMAFFHPKTPFFNGKSLVGSSSAPRTEHASPPPPVVSMLFKHVTAKGCAGPTLTSGERGVFQIQNYWPQKGHFQIEVCHMMEARKCVRFQPRKLCSAAYGVASLRVSRQITGRDAESVAALYQEGEEWPFFSGPNPDPKNARIEPENG